MNLTGEQSRDLERKREHWWQACPSCGRRFHIRLVSKKLLHVDTGKEKVFPNVNFLSPRQVGNIIDNELTGEYHTIAPYPLSTEGINVIVTEDFEYLCRCSHCKHEWAEKRTISVS